MLIIRSAIQSHVDLLTHFMLTYTMMEYHCLGPMESWDLSQVEEETLWAFFCLEVLCVLYLWHWYLNHSYVSVPVLLRFSLVWPLEYLKPVPLKTPWAHWSQGFLPDKPFSTLIFTFFLSTFYSWCHSRSVGESLHEFALFYGNQTPLL